jgi:UDP-N-acetylmuramate dehydrogenase
MPLFVLGGGSNLLVSDLGFKGIVLHIAIMGIQASPERSADIYQAAAGEDWDQFVQLTLENNCAGLECLAGIPGTVGGTPVQNVGAYGQEVGNVIERVRAFDLREHTFVDFASADCGFAYRQSRFNTTDRGRFIVTRVDFKLVPGGSPTLRYADLQKAFLPFSNPTLTKVAETVRRVRQSKGMLLVNDDENCHSAGSFFKNPIVSTAQAERVAAITAEEPPRFSAGPANEGFVKLSAAWLIERAGFAKGFAEGRAAISSKHTLALVNRGGASAEEIMALAQKILAGVTARFDVDLKTEPVMLGFETA